MTLPDSLAHLQTILATWHQHPASHHHQAAVLLLTDQHAEPGSVYATTAGDPIGLPIDVDMVLIANPTDAAIVGSVFTEWNWHVLTPETIAERYLQTKRHRRWWTLAIAAMLVAAMLLRLLF